MDFRIFISVLLLRTRETTPLESESEKQVLSDSETRVSLGERETEVALEGSLR